MAADKIRDGEKPRPFSGDGIWVSMEELRALRRTALHLSAGSAGPVRSLFPGTYRAMFRGRGIEFDETRYYIPGDDYRTLDWRVTARTGQMHTKLYHEERERSFHIVLDARAAMHFGSRMRYKWVQAARTAAVFAWMSVDNDDPVGTVIFGEQRQPLFIPPGRSESAVLALFHVLTGPRTQITTPTANMADALRMLRKRARPGSRILLVSDFEGFSRIEMRHLAQLSRHSALAAIQIYDALEKELPPPGLYPVTDGTHEQMLDSSSPRRRQEYTAAFTDKQYKLRAALRQQGIRLLPLAADASLTDRLRSVPGVARRGGPSRHRSPAL